jgi:hypothetical protein
VADGAAVATSFPNLARAFFEGRGKAVRVAEMSGAAEVAPHLGIADLIVDLVSTGSTLRVNGLVELATVLESSARLVARPRAARTDVVTKALDELAVRQLLGRAPGRDLPGEGLFRQVLDRGHLAPREPRRAQQLVRSIGDLLRPRATARPEARADAAVDRRRGLAGELLVDDRLEQRLVRALARRDLQPARADLADQSGEGAVLAAEMRDSGIDVERR